MLSKKWRNAIRVQYAKKVLNMANKSSCQWTKYGYKRAVFLEQTRALNLNYTVDPVLQTHLLEIQKV